jgi:hypothetical protein
VKQFESQHLLRGVSLPVLNQLFHGVHYRLRGFLAIFLGFSKKVLGGGGICFDEDEDLAGELRIVGLVLAALLDEGGYHRCRCRH